MEEKLHLSGKYIVQCHDKVGNLKWKDVADNVVTDLGANLILNDAFGTATALYFLGLISSVGYTGAPIAADTMASHSGVGSVWAEAGNGSNYPTWSTPASNARGTITWAAASGRAKAITAITFTFDHSGTVKGCFVVTGTGASATNNNTSGTLLSAGVFSGGDRAVLANDTLTVSYSIAG